MDRADAESTFERTRSQLLRELGDMDEPDRARILRERCGLLVRRGDLAVVNLVLEVLRKSYRERLLDTRDSAFQNEYRGALIALDEAVQEIVNRASTEMKQQQGEFFQEQFLGDLPSYLESSS